jgi:hypothetical protein
MRWVIMVSCLFGCTLDESAVEQSVSAQNGSPAWILNPVDFPQGRMGTTNCTFKFGCGGADFNAHPDAGCWEKEPTADGWVRQQIFDVHCAQIANCGAAGGDAYAIRVCRAGGGGQASPCLNTDGTAKLTGPNGCAVCVANPVCH